jgi:hypothetical protein
MRQLPGGEVLDDPPVRGSTTSTVFDPELGTYTRAGSWAAAWAMSPGRSAA